MSQRYHANTERPRPKENQLGILNITHFAGKFSREPQVQERALWVCTWKVATFPLKVPATLLNGLKKGGVGA